MASPKATKPSSCSTTSRSEQFPMRVEDTVRIAEELGCPRSTVQFRRSKALLALRARLEEVIGDDEL